MLVRKQHTRDTGKTAESARHHDSHALKTHLVFRRRILGLTSQLDGLFEAHDETTPEQSGTRGVTGLAVMRTALKREPSSDALSDRMYPVCTQLGME